MSLTARLTNEFVDMHKNKLFSKVRKSYMYVRYVDDTFAIFECEGECNLV